VNKPPTINSPWSLRADEIFRLLQSSRNGLNENEAANRLKKFGLNKISVTKKKMALTIFLSQFKEWFTLILIFASVASFILGEKVDAYVILSLIALSATVGFFQEYKAEKTIEDLKKILSHRTSVTRGGVIKTIKSDAIIPGDIVIVKTGDRIPADLRIIEADNLSINEAVLTGESRPALKIVDPINKVNASIFEQKNMAFAGSFVATGKGVGIVIATGLETYFGKIAKNVDRKEPPTDFQKQIKNFGGFLLKVIILLTIFVFLANSVSGKGIFDSFLFATALAVGITPELLPAIITVTLSKGAGIMAKQKVVVKKLISIEDLGNVDVICTDKTGTLTLGKFSLNGYFNADEERDEEVLTAAVLCSEYLLSDGGVEVNQIDKSLIENPIAANILAKTKNKYQILDKNDFDFDRKVMSVLVKKGTESTLIVKGAYEEVLKASATVRLKGKITKLTPKSRLALEKRLDELTSSSLKVIAVATKPVKKSKTNLADENNLTFVGWLIFEDPIKPDLVESVSIFEKLGVDIKIVSGDSPQIVLSVANLAGLCGKDENVILGKEIDSLNESQLFNLANTNRLFARFNPEQKSRLVASLNKEDHIVAFLGDGVNDAPALKAADVGISVDTGTEVAKDSADIILLKKDLKLLAIGIKEGRKTFANILKYILNTVSANYGNMSTVALSSLFLPFIPLLPKQILLNNFLSDLPLFAVATDNVDSEFVRKPKRWNIGLIGKFMVVFGTVSSLFDFALIIPLLFLWKVSPDTFRTAWFIESSLSEIIVTFAIRTRLSFLKSVPGRLLVALSIFASAIIILLAIYPEGMFLFGFEPMTQKLWLWVFIVVGSYFFTLEIVKRFFYKKISNFED
jgi:Mg2+-importing ATPase